MNKPEENLGCIFLIVLAIAVVMFIFHHLALDAGAQAPDYGYGARCVCAICWYLSGERQLPDTWQWHHALYGQWVSVLEATAGYWNPRGVDCWQEAWDGTPAGR